MISIKAIYDGKNLQLLEPFNIQTPQEVIITFLETNSPATNFSLVDKENNRQKVRALAGAWDELPEDDFQDYLKFAKQSGRDAFGKEVKL